MKQAVVQQARLLLLDEPTANLDMGNQIKVLRVIRELADQGYTVLMTSHLPITPFSLGAGWLSSQMAGLRLWDGQKRLSPTRS